MRANLRTNWLICYYRRLRFFAQTFPNAGVAQLVEQLICNHQVGGSSPFTGSNKYGGFVNWTTISAKVKNKLKQAPYSACFISLG